MALDLIVKNGVVIDGSGLARRRADVGVAGGRVVEIGRIPGRATCVIDADGLIVAPGIVDAHTHYDPQLGFDPYATSSCYHGVTTVVTGNCGLSVVPCRPDDQPFMMGMFGAVEAVAPEALSSADWKAEDFTNFLKRRDSHLGVNMAMYIGHSSVRRWAMGPDGSKRAATEEEVRVMQALVAEAVRNGAAGFSSSMGANQFDGDGLPIPSRFASDDEVLALADAAGSAGRGSMSYLPAAAALTFSEADRDNLIKLALTSGWPVIVQGLGGTSKVDAPSADSWQSVLDFYDATARAGAAVFSLLRVQPFDRPFTIAGGTQIFQAVREMHELLQASSAQKRSLISDPVVRQRIREGLRHPNTDPKRGPTAPPPGWTTLLVKTVTRPEHAELVGRSIASIANERRHDPLDVMLDLSIAEDLELEFLYRNDHEDWLEAVDLAQGHPNMILGVSDGGAHLDRDDGAWWSSYFLRKWVVERKRWTLEEGIRKITHQPASLVGISDRGLIAPGFAADMFIFDPETVGPGWKGFVHDLPAGAGRYCSRPIGVKATIVNGAPIVLDGELTGELPGRVVGPNLLG